MAERKDRIGETRTMRNGKKAKIIVYRGYEDIDIQFESGETRAHVSYGNFKKGVIAIPGLNPVAETARHERVGERRIMNCGMCATIVEYRNAKDLDVIFDDGTKVCNKAYGKFQDGKNCKSKYKQEGFSRFHKIK